MAYKPFITSIFLASLLLVLTSCQLFQQAQQAGDYVSGKVQLEQKKTADKTLALVKCQELCQVELYSGDSDFTVGPCLSNAIIPDWVCDIAHEPRQAIDDDPANQCAAFHDGTAHHFVEVDGNCNQIEVY